MFYAHDCYRSPMKSRTSYCSNIHKYEKVMLIRHRRGHPNILQSCAFVKEQNGLRLFTDFHGQGRRILCLGHGLTTFFKMRPGLRGGPAEHRNTIHTGDGAYLTSLIWTCSYVYGSRVVNDY